MGEKIASGEPTMTMLRSIWSAAILALEMRETDRATVGKLIEMRELETFLSWWSLYGLHATVMLPMGIYGILARCISLQRENPAEYYPSCSPTFHPGLIGKVALIEHALFGGNTPSR